LSLAEVLWAVGDQLRRVIRAKLESTLWEGAEEIGSAGQVQALPIPHEGNRAAAPTEWFAVHSVQSAPELFALGLFARRPIISPHRVRHRVAPLWFEDGDQKADQSCIARVWQNQPLPRSISEEPWLT